MPAYELRISDWSSDVCSSDLDVLLATRLGKAIRFQVADVRLFRGRDSLGVRGLRLGDGDQVVSMSILRHVDYHEVEGTEHSERDVYRSEERSGGTECVGTCRTRGSPYT